MGWPPRTPPSLAECQVEANGECVMRSGAHRIGCPDTRPIKIEERHHLGGRASRQRKKSVEVEGDFDLHAAVDGLPARANRRPHLPVPHLREGFFFQAKPGALDDDRVDHAPIGCDRHVEQHRSLIFGLARFVGVFRLRAINALGRADTVYTSAEDAAAGTAAFAWAEASARAAPDTAGFARPDTATAAWAAGISHGGRERIAHVGQGRVGYFQIRWTKERWVHRDR